MNTRMKEHIEKIKSKAKQYLIEETLKEEFNLKCPKCNSKNVTDCKGGTCLKPIDNIKFICTDCLNEW